MQDREDLKPLINELLGVKLSKHMNLQTIEYSVAKDRIDGEIIGLSIDNYRKENTRYIMPSNLSSDDLRSIRRLLMRIRPIKSPFKRDLANYIFRNYYAAEKDSSVLCTRKGNYLRLGPLSNYRNSFNDPNLEIYRSDLFKGEKGHSVKIDLHFLEETVIKSYLFYNAYQQVLKFDMYSALHDIEKREEISIPPHLKEEYYAFDEQRKKILTKIN